MSNFYGLSSLTALYTSPVKPDSETPPVVSGSHEDFAEKILDLELQLQQTCTLKLINALMEAYSVRNM